jgi:hypothetical protein
MRLTAADVALAGRTSGASFFCMMKVKPTTAMANNIKIERMICLDQHVMSQSPPGDCQLLRAFAGVT